MYIALVDFQKHWGQSEGPEEKASRYTVRPGTRGLTLSKYSSSSIWWTGSAQVRASHNTTEAAGSLSNTSEIMACVSNRR
jgi:hypothetical protein